MAYCIAAGTRSRTGGYLLQQIGGIPCPTTKARSVSQIEAKWPKTKIMRSASSPTS